MNYLEASRILTVVASMGMTVGLYHQVYKIYKTKSAKDFSPIIVIVMILSEIIWLNYGLAIREWPIEIVSAINLPGMFALGFGFLKYGRIRKELVMAQKS